MVAALALVIVAGATTSTGVPDEQLWRPAILSGNRELPR
jgi:hypothetical protein